MCNYFLLYNYVNPLPAYSAKKRHIPNWTLQGSSFFQTLMAELQKLVSAKQAIGGPMHTQWLKLHNYYQKTVHVCMTICIIMLNFVNMTLLYYKGIGTVGKGGHAPTFGHEAT